ncbi:hypothetical protein V6N12_035421 [Hibiscus sabdariffa]|uniref:Uncharacterized protein n=1 Tax=Hibiscus sabdariffa TaxID=183260 RepID=A0ABR2EN03_9ROSI
MATSSSSSAEGLPSRFNTTAVKERYHNIVAAKNRWEEQGFLFDDGLCRNQLSMLRLYLCKGFNNLLEQDDKGDVSAETTGPAPAEVSAGTQISAERLLCYWLIPKSK